MSHPLALALAAAALLGCHGGPTEFIEGTWTGFVADGDLDAGVELVDPLTTFTITVYPGQTWEGRELWADIVIDGAMEVYGVALDGAEEDTVTDVHLADTRLLVKPKVGGLTLKTRGRYSEDFEQLELDVRFVGELYLDEVFADDEAADEAPTAQGAAPDGVG
jgi:hypothetical protein